MWPYKVGDRLECIRWDGVVFTKGNIYVVQEVDAGTAIVPRDDTQNGRVRNSGILPSFMGKYFVNLGPEPRTEDGAREYEEAMMAQELLK